MLSRIIFTLKNVSSYFGVSNEVLDPHGELPYMYRSSQHYLEKVKAETQPKKKKT